MKTIKELITTNPLTSSMLNSLIDLTIERLDLPINVYNDSKDDNYNYYDELYQYLLYNVIEYGEVLTHLGINNTDDLIEFHELVN